MRRGVDAIDTPACTLATATTRSLRARTLLRLSLAASSREQGRRVTELQPPRSVVPAPDDASQVIARGACPMCAATPFAVSGSNCRIAADNAAYEADARCVDCNAVVGTLRHEYLGNVFITDEET